MSRQVAVRITDLNSRGEGVGRDGGRVLFVPGALPGDLAEVRYADTRSGALPANLVQLVRPSVERRQPVCRHQPVCGGCPLMPLPEPAALALKVRHLTEVLRRIGRIEAAEITVVPSPDPLGYRGRLRFAVGRSAGRAGPGFRRSGSSERTVIVDRCHLAPAAATELAWELIRELDRARAALPTELEMRGSTVTGTWLAVCHAEDEPPRESIDALRRCCEREERIAGVCWVQRQGSAREVVRLLVGEEILPERIGSLDVELRPTGFLQVNLGAAKQLYAEAARLAATVPGACRRLADLYCGQGLLALNVAPEGARVWAVDSSMASVRAARSNARKAGRRGWRFETGDALVRFERFVSGGGTCDLVSANPPRKGAGSSLPRLVQASGARGVLLVSCHPAALARDLRRLLQTGFQIQAVSAVDMFPQTAHLEALALVTR